MKIGVVTPNLESYGGVSQCAVSCIEALNDKKITPDVFSIAGDKKIVNKKFGKKLEYNFVKLFAPKRMVIYSMIFKNFQMFFKDYDYVYDFSNAIPFNKKDYFSYVLFPEYIGAERGKYNKGIWRLYYLPKKILNPLIKYLAKKSNVDFVALSDFTADHFYKTSGRKIPVIYPPCNIDEFKNKEKIIKKKQVITIGGFTVEKRQEDQVKIASHFPEINFEICGSATRNPFYLNKIKSLSKNIKNVHLNPNRPFSEISKKLSQSLIFLHASEGEPFGIATVEAISAGCIPIVHNSGGQKEVVPFKELRFNDKKEAVKKISDVLKWDDKKIGDYKKKLQGHIKKFDKVVFKKKLMKYIE